MKHLIKTKTTIYAKLIYCLKDTDFIISEHNPKHRISLTLSNDIYGFRFGAWMWYDENIFNCLNILKGKDLKLSVNEYYDAETQGKKRPESIEVIAFETSKVTDFETAFNELKKAYQDIADKIEDPDEYVRELRGGHDRNKTDL